MSRRRCPNCDASKTGRCSRCHGTGYLDMFQDPFSVPVTLIGGERTKCDRCGGDGRCKTCGGSGLVREEEPRAKPRTPKPETLVQPDSNRDTVSHGDSSPSTGASGGGFAPAGVGRAIGLALLIGFFAWWGLILRSAPQPDKPQFLPTEVTSGPSGTSFYFGEGDPMAFQAYNDGNYFLHQSNYSQAVAYFTEAIRRNPNYADAYLNRGTAYDGLGRNDLALQDFGAVIRLRPTEPKAYYGRARIEQGLGRQQDAISDVTQALSLNPTESRDVYYRLRGSAYSLSNQFQSAIEDFDESLRLKPQDAFSLGSRAAARGNLGQYQAAIEDYNDAIRLGSAEVWLLLGRGTTYEHLGLYQNAMRDYDEAVRLDPSSVQAQKYQNDAILRSRYRESNQGVETAQNDSTISDTDTSDRPTSASQAQATSDVSDCYSGTWHENDASNGFLWYFRRLGSNLHISRTDGFVYGDFRPEQDGWSGSLNWGNGAQWNGVTLRANEACSAIETNQRWSYKR